jgi:adenine-specific DNA-methyltransferase
VNKLYRWGEDVKLSLESEIKDLDKEVRELRRSSVLAQSLQDKLNLQKEIREIERRRTGKRRDLFNAQDSIDTQRDDLIGTVEEKLKQTSTVEPLFTIRWTIQ